MARIQPSSEKKLKVTCPAFATVKFAVKAAWNMKRLPTPAWLPFPWATKVEQVPSGLGTTSVKGRVNSLMPVELEQPTWAPEGGLKSITGNCWEKLGPPTR